MRAPKLPPNCWRIRASLFTPQTMKSRRLIPVAETTSGRFFSAATNGAMCRAFMENALRDPISNEIGKGIAYCVSQNHAAKITRILNQLAAEMFPGRYRSDFAIQVTSRVEDAQSFARQFANNNLRGQTRFLDGYPSSRTRVCVTVGMMTHRLRLPPDILNLCFMRPLFSPSEFIQIKGRGTRAPRLYISGWRGSGLS